MDKSKEVGYDDVVEAMYECHGIKGSAITWLKINKGINTNRNMIEKIIEEWKLEDFVHELRVNSAEMCLKKMFSKGIEEGDFRCMEWVLREYGQHVDFLERREASIDSGISPEDVANLKEVMEAIHKSRERS